MRAAYIAAFRTYTWNADVKELADRFFAACPSGRHVILADETRQSLGITGYEVISHTEDTTHLGLHVEPGNKSLWFNVDYGIYILRNALPGYPYYLLSESDLAVNLSLDPMMEAVARRGIDFVAHDFKKSMPGWFWHANAAAVFDDPWGCLLFFIVASASAADFLLEARQKLSVQRRTGELTTWPFCEPFVASVLKQSDLRIAEVAEFAKTHNLRFRPRIPIDDPRANEPGSLVHSVASRWQCFQEAAEANPRAWFSKQSGLRELSASLPFNECAAFLQARFAAQMDWAGLAKMTKEIDAADGTPSNPDLAFCKPSLASSTSKWSRFSDPLKDAAGANGPKLDQDYGFHTNLEDSPWWMVDFTTTCVVTHAEILNRQVNESRFRQFVIESSLDSNCWSFQFIKIDLEPVPWLESDPFRIEFKSPFVARYIRIRMLGTGVLHLRRVRVFGREVPPD